MYCRAFEKDILSVKAKLEPESRARLDAASTVHLRANDRQDPVSTDLIASKHVPIQATGVLVNCS